MRTFLTRIVLLLSLVMVTSCGPDCTPCSRVKFVEPEKILFLGYERVKVHGPVNKNGTEEYQNMTIYKYLIDGHDFAYSYLTGTHADFGIYHLPSCRKCQEDTKKAEGNYQGLKNDLENLINTSSRTITKDELQAVLKKQEQNIVRQFDNILDSWD